MNAAAAVGVDRTTVAKWEEGISDVNFHIIYTPPNLILKTVMATVFTGRVGGYIVKSPIKW